MNRRIVSSLLGALIFGLFGPGGAAAVSLDPLLRELQRAERTPRLRAEGAASLAAPLVAITRSGEEATSRVGVILHLEPGAATPRLPRTWESGARVGDWMTVRLPLGEIDRLAELDDVLYAEAGKPVTLRNDMALPDVGVPDVWSGSPAYTGSGVLVGVIDTGIDWRHGDFRKGDGTTRVVTLWDQTGTGTPPSPYGYGAEYSAAQINSALAGGGGVNQADTNGHGSHVAGTAAGDGSASSGQYRGVAFEADLAIVKTTLTTDALIDATSYLRDVAQARQQPLVVNMSLGGHAGAHDGTSAHELVIDQLSGPGTVFVIAAGNEGEAFIHDSGSAVNGSLTFAIRNESPTPGSGNDVVGVGAWVDGASTPSVRVGFDGGFTDYVLSGTTQTFDTPSGFLTIDNASGGPNPINGDREIFFQWDDRTGSDPTTADWDVQFQGGTGTVHAWVYGGNIVSGFLDSDQDFSVGMPATAEKAVSVAAYKTRNSWPSQQGTNSYAPGSSLGDAAIGDHAPFSSRGPTRDDRQKPDLAAPGAAIVSCHSDDTDPPTPAGLLLPGGAYFATQGTSMATPLTSGVVALMLERNGERTAEQIRATLIASVATDVFTGTGWSSKWGHGKVDALAAVLATPGGAVANGDVDGDGRATVLDVVRIVDYIVDPGGHPLTSDQRAHADVFPATGGDGTIDASDVARIVAFILETDTPGASPEAPPTFAAPVRVEVAAGRPATDGASSGGGEVEILVQGDGVTAGQFAVAWNGAAWRPEAVTVEGAGGAGARAFVVANEIRVLFHGVSDDVAAAGLRVILPYAPGASGTIGSPELRGVRIAGERGHLRAVDLGGAPFSVGSRLASLHVAPNPAPRATSFAFRLTAPASPRLEIFDVGGRRLRRFADEPRDAGDHRVAWDGLDGSGRQAPSGVYFVRLQSGEESLTRRVVLTR